MMRRTALLLAAVCGVYRRLARFPRKPESHARRQSHRRACLRSSAGPMDSPSSPFEGALAGSHEWIEFDGTQTFWPLMDGRDPFGDLYPPVKGRFGMGSAPSMLT